MDFFGGLHKKFNGRIMFGELMELSGKSIGDMPTHPEHNNDGRNGLCFNWLGGVCPFPNCRQKGGHLPKKEVSEELANEIKGALETGVAKLLQGERGSRSGKKRR